MTPREFSEAVARGEIPSLLLFEGPEEYLKQSALQELRRALLPEGLESLNETRLEAPALDELIAAAETLPFMADRRLILLRDHPGLTGRADAEEGLIEYLASVPPTTVLLFYCVLPIRHQKIVNAVKKHGAVVKFEALQEQELTAWVVRAFRDQGRECDERTADALIFTCGTDMNVLLREIAKIASFHPEEPRLDPKDVQALATPSTAAVVFRMVEAVVAGQEKKAFQLLRDLLRTGENRVMILSMLLRQFRLLQQIRIMQYERRSTDDITRALGMKPWMARQYIRQAGLYTGPQVKDAVALCLNAEFDIKSGRLRDEGTLEALMLKLLLLRRKEAP